MKRVKITICWIILRYVSMMVTKKKTFCAHNYRSVSVVIKVCSSWKYSIEPNFMRHRFRKICYRWTFVWNQPSLEKKKLHSSDAFPTSSNKLLTRSSWKKNQFHKWSFSMWVRTHREAAKVNSGSWGWEE